MMKKTVFLLLSAAAFLFFCGSGGKALAQEETQQEYARINLDAEDIHYSKTPLNKLGRGLINIVTCWAEIPGQAYKVAEEKDPLTGSTLGVVEGFCSAGLRGLSGIFDVATFLIPPYNKPLMKPEYALGSAFEQFQQHKEQFSYEDGIVDCR